MRGSEGVKRLELLAPARDLECGKAAIDCGADAVYIGGPRFGAREKASNEIEAIGRLSEYAHKYWARVYVTVNTLLRDEEVEEAVELIWEMYRVGADAVIIQDVGLLECELPPIALIASTQMHNHTPERVKFLEGVGFTRVILARELTLEEIKAIRAAAPEVELECFVHGALCVCYSGQCYLSYARGGRSGNRGACAQPCRLRYRLVDREGRMVAGPGYLLSLKDLNLTGALGELAEAGVTSFKIEGRLKDRGYVMNTVAWYRRELDEVIRSGGYGRGSSGRSVSGFIPEIEKTFNRGYTRYYLHGVSEGVNEARSPKWIGEPVGRVVSVLGRVVELEGANRVGNGDGISYFDAQGELKGTRVNVAEGRRLVVQEELELQPGEMVYRNYDHAFMRALERVRPRREIGVEFEIQIRERECVCRVSDEDGVRVQTRCVWEGNEVSGRADARGRLMRQFEKCGGTEFRCLGVQVVGEIERVPRVAELNRLRREALQRLATQRAIERPRMVRRAGGKRSTFPERRLDYTGNVLNQRAAAFYRRHGVEAIEIGGDARETLKNEVVMRTRYCPLRERGMCVRNREEKNVRAPLFLVDDEGIRLELRCNKGACCMEYILRGKAGL
ncbi:MAG: U32 family peptidase [bacterium]|nr:U32 family peptidase [bacterium]